MEVHAMTNEVMDCGHNESPHGEHTRGYGQDAKGRRYCYDCCASLDLAEMAEHGRWTGYYVGGYITNWPGSLKFPATRVNRGKGRGFGGTYELYTGTFSGPDGFVWSFRNAGDMDLARCKRTQKRVA